MAERRMISRKISEDIKNTDISVNFQRGSNQVSGNEQVFNEPGDKMCLVYL